MIPEKLKNQIQVVQGDITKLDCDCIVNAANRSLLGGGGVDGTIHRAAGPELLADCYRNSLNLAKEYDIHSIAFPAISAGAYGYPLEDATELAVKAVAQWLEAHADYAMQVIFCCFDARTERVYKVYL
mgnify:FL=1